MIDRHGSDPNLRVVPAIPVEEPEKTPPATPNAIAFRAAVKEEFEELEGRLENKILKLFEKFEARLAETVVNALSTRMVQIEIAQRANAAELSLLQNKHNALRTAHDALAAAHAELVQSHGEVAISCSELKAQLASLEQRLHPPTIPAPAPSETDPDHP